MSSIWRVFKVSKATALLYTGESLEGIREHKSDDLSPNCEKPEGFSELVEGLVAAWLGRQGGPDAAKKE